MKMRNARKRNALAYRPVNPKFRKRVDRRLARDLTAARYRSGRAAWVRHARRRDRYMAPIGTATGRYLRVVRRAARWVRA